MSQVLASYEDEFDNTSVWELFIRLIEKIALKSDYPDQTQEDLQKLYHSLSDITVLAPLDELHVACIKLYTIDELIDQSPSNYLPIVRYLQDLTGDHSYDSWNIWFAYYSILKIAYRYPDLNLHTIDQQFEKLNQSIELMPLKIAGLLVITTRQIHKNRFHQTDSGTYQILLKALKEENLSNTPVIHFNVLNKLMTSSMINRDLDQVFALNSQKRELLEKMGKGWNPDDRILFSAIEMERMCGFLLDQDGTHYLDYLDQALEYANSLKDPIIVSHLLSEKMLVYYNLSQFERATEIADEIIERGLLKKKIDENDNNLADLAMAHNTLGEYSKTIELLEEPITNWINSDIKNYYTFIPILTSFYRATRKSGELIKGLQQTKRVIEKIEYEDNPMEKQFVDIFYMRLISLYTYMGQLDVALKVGDYLYSKIDDMVQFVNQDRVLYEIAHLYYLKSDIEQSKHWMTKLQEMIDERPTIFDSNKIEYRLLEAKLLRSEKTMNSFYQAGEVIRKLNQEYPNSEQIKLELINQRLEEMKLFPNQDNLDEIISELENLGQLNLRKNEYGDYIDTRLIEIQFHLSTTILEQDLRELDRLKELAREKGLINKLNLIEEEKKSLIARLEEMSYTVKTNESILNEHQQTKVQSYLQKALSYTSNQI